MGAGAAVLSFFFSFFCQRGGTWRERKRWWWQWVCGQFHCSALVHCDHFACATTSGGKPSGRHSEQWHSESSEKAGAAAAAAAAAGATTRAEGSRFSCKTGNWLEDSAFVVTAIESAFAFVTTPAVAIVVVVVLVCVVVVATTTTAVISPNPFPVAYPWT
jgi:hypothetical protein